MGIWDSSQRTASREGFVAVGEDGDDGAQYQAKANLQQLDLFVRGCLPSIIAQLVPGGQVHS